MSLSKGKNIFECSDCSATDAEWASLNRGVIICDDCCIIHRNLGREISQVKSIRKSHWSPSQLQMVIDLYSSGSNSIWEYSLINSVSGSLTSSLANSMRSSRKKPNPRDPLYPTKNDFITAKYSKQAFIKKKIQEEGESASSISEELHSSVRSSSLKTSLRLLAAGANPNYLHPEKGNTPLHVAAKSGQLYQVELLFVYGADPLKQDSNGKTALDCAKVASHNEIVDRLIEFQFEVTDRISHFLCGRRPDHRQGQHYLVPEMVDSVMTVEEVAGLIQKLKNLNEREFENLVKDVYDEVDRRELEEIWLQLRSPLSSDPPRDRNLLPYLPINSMFSTTRNQGRQKLARFSARDFSILLIDILIETKRRHLNSSQKKITHKKKTNARSNVVSNISLIRDGSDNEDSDPLYDSVASEEERDYDEVENEPQQAPRQELRNGLKPVTNRQRKSLEDRLTESDTILREVLASNEEMKREISDLKNTVNNLVNENMQLRTLVLSKHNLSDNLQPPAILPRSSIRTGPRSQSMFDRTSNPTPEKTPQPNTIAGYRSPLPPSSGIVGQSYSDKEISNSPHPASCPKPPAPTPSSSTCSSEGLSLSNNHYEYVFDSPRPTPRAAMFPAKEDVYRRTEQITRGIQELLKVSLEGRQELNPKCAESIQQAVEAMVSLFPEKSQFSEMSQTGEEMYKIIELLKSNCNRLMTECGAGQSSVSSQIVERIIDSAYDIARFAKQLILLSTEL